MSNKFGNGRIARKGSHMQLWFILNNLFLLKKNPKSSLLLCLTELNPKSSITLNGFFQNQSILYVSWNEVDKCQISRYSSCYQLWFILNKLFLFNNGKISPMILGWTELDQKTSITFKTIFFFK